MISDNARSGMQQAPARSLFNALGFTAEELKKRLIGRGTESAEVIEKRLRRAAEESDGMDSYDYIVVNDDVDTCVEDLHSLIRSSHFKESANTDLVARMKQELHDMTK